MTIKLSDKKHPKNYDCNQCGVPAGSWCKTKNGALLNGYEKQHRNRHRKVDSYIGGQMVAGTLVPFVCVKALNDLERRWPGATLESARLVVIEVVLNAAKSIEEE